MSVSSRLSAPSQDGAILAVPALAEVNSLVENNRRLLSASGPDLLGRSLTELRAEARRGALRAAREYFAQSNEPLPPVIPESLLLAGHQPELSHPGVWIKNFALNTIAQRNGATSLTLIVDNDTVKSTTLRLPCRKTESVTDSWYRAQMPFDFHGSDVPYEERAVADEAIFESLPARAVAITSSWGFEPVLGEFWREVLKQRPRTPLLGERFASARRCFERHFGCHNLEIPVSRLCSTEAFAWFACHLLSNLSDFQPIYNEIVREYRQSHEIRSRNHPVPDLAREDDWLEAPFWFWRRGDGRRGRLFVRCRDRFREMRAGADAWRMPCSKPREWLEEVAGRGLKIRPRALTTTLYARLLLADLFVHGIGGAKYDELTDQILRRFYKIDPPAYLILSGTLLLPLAGRPVDRTHCDALDRQLRDMWHNPQRHLRAADPLAHKLAEEKRQWTNRACPTAAERKERFIKLRELTADLRPFLVARRDALTKQADECHELLESESVLARRDYAFCLFPEHKLRAFCQQFLQ